MNALAEQFLECYRQGVEPSGGLLYAKALQQARLDYSPESLERLEQLLTQIREKVGLDEATLTAHPGGLNFCYLAAFYLGDYVRREVGRSLAWHDYPQAREVLPADFGLPEAFFSRIFGLIEGRVFLPLGWIGEMLFTPDGSSLSCGSYIAAFVEKLRAREQMSDDDWFRDYLERFFAGRKIPGGLAFRSSLERLRLDFSLDSLRRTDDLCDQLRETIPLNPEQFLQGQDKTNFVLFLAYYMGATLAREGCLALHWMNFKETRESIPDLPESFDTSISCVLGDRIHFPLGLVCERLFSATPERTFHGFAQELLRTTPPNYRPFSRPTADTPVTAPLTPAWAEALKATGFLAAWEMWMACGGTSSMPTLLVPGAEGKNTLIRLEDDTAQHSLARGHRALEENPENAPFLVLVYAASTYLPTGLGPLLVAETRVYGPTPLTCKLYFPYNTAAGVFSIGTPLLVELSPDQESSLALRQALYEGIGNFRMDDFNWVETGVFCPSSPPPPEESRNTDGNRASDPPGPPIEFERLLQAAEAGSPEAQFQLAMRYQEGHGVPRNYELCVKWYQRAADQGHSAAINNLADKYEHGLGVPQNLDLALQLYLKAADLGIIAAWYSLGMMYFEGRGVLRDLVKAIRWMQDAAHYDFLDARDQLREMTAQQAIVLDSNAAADLANAAILLARADNLPAERLAEAAEQLYDPERPQTMPPAFQLYLQAALKGHSEAQHQVAFRYERGLGVPRDTTAALEWYERSAAAGNAHSMERLGEIHDAGELVPRNERQAFRFFLNAVNHGAIFSAYTLACMYQEGRGTAVNKIEALRWMKEAAKVDWGDSRDRVAALMKEVPSPAAPPPTHPESRFWPRWGKK